LLPHLRPENLRICDGGQIGPEPSKLPSGADRENDRGRDEWSRQSTTPYLIDSGNDAKVCTPE